MSGFNPRRELSQFDFMMIMALEFHLGNVPIMLDRREIISDFHSAIQHGTRYDEPYLLYTFSPFTQQLYDKILASLPRDEDYIKQEHYGALRPDGTSTRLIFPLKGDRIRRCFSGESREFWLNLTDILRDSELWNLFKTSLEPELKKRSGTSLNKLEAFPTLTAC